MNSKPALSAYGKWLKDKRLDGEPYNVQIDYLFSEYEKMQTKLIEEVGINAKLTESLSRFADAALNRPIVLRTMKDDDVMGLQRQFNRSIELLEACSEDLFLFNSAGDCNLEKNIDTFINEVTP